MLARSPAPPFAEADAEATVEVVPEFAAAPDEPEGEATTLVLDDIEELDAVADVVLAALEVVLLLLVTDPPVPERV